MNNLNFNPNQLEKDPLKIPISVAETHLIKGKPEFEQNEQKDIKIVLFSIISTFNQALKEIKEQPKQNSASEFTEALLLIDLLKTLNKLFTKLRSENSSQDIQFVQQLAKSYQNLSDQLSLMTSLEKKTNFFIHSVLLIDSVGQYPAGHSFTLGYYLKNYSGENWLPFPLMKILEQLHIEASEEAASAHLVIWTNTIEELIENLQTNKLSTPQHE